MRKKISECRMGCVFRCILPPLLTLDKGGVAKRTSTLVGRYVCGLGHIPVLQAIQTQLLQSDIHELG